MANDGRKVVSPWKADEELGDFESKDNGGSAWATFAKAAAFLFIIALAGFGYYYFSTRPSGANVSIDFSQAGQEIFSGQPFKLTVSFSNNSEQVLKNAILSVQLPDNVFYLGGSQGQRVMETKVGDVGPGSVNPDVFDLLVVGDAQSVKRIDARLSYQLNGSTAEFENKKSFDLSVGQKAVDLNFELPQSVFSGSNFDITVKYRNNAGQDFSDDAVLKIDYPSGFNFVKASADNLSGNNKWNLGKLPKGASGEFKITGNLTGAERSSLDFRGTISTSFKGQNFDITGQTASVSISESPLSISATVNGSDNYIAHAGNELFYNLRYKNVSSVPFRNLIIKASFSGEMFDFSTAKTDAAFNPANNTFTWMTANTSALSQLPPNGEGTVFVDIQLKKDFPIRRLSDKNYTLKLDIQMESPTVPQGTLASKTMTVGRLETKVAGRIQLQTKALWRDAASGILNNGNYPPRVNQPTQYTIHWLLTNYSTDISNAVVSAFLQSGARWTGKVKSNVDSQPNYDSSTGKVTWNIGNLLATKGITSDAPEAVFQVEVTPSANQINQYITFLSSASAQAEDGFTGVQLTDSARELNTLLPDDTTISQSINRAVQP